MRLYGKNPVIERLRTNPHSIRKISMQEGYSDAAYIHKKAKKWGISVVVVPRRKMEKMGRHSNTQGILVEVDDFPYVPFEELLDEVLLKRRILFFLDGLMDPQNLGAIFRSLACLGKFSLVLPTHNSVDVTESVLRIASGGENYVPVAKVANLNKAIQAAQKAGVWMVGTVSKEGKPLGELPFSFPLGLVMGSEDKGIRDVIRRSLDAQVTIPMASQTLSFNVAHATTILGYEAKKQENKYKK